MINLPVAEKSKLSFKQLIRYTFIGLVSNLIGYLIYLVITYIGVTPKITMTLMYAMGATIGYAGNRIFTFSHKGNLAGSSFRYLIVHFFGYFINLAILTIFVDHLMYPHQSVQAVAVFVVAGFLFIGYKFFVFTKLNELK